MKDGLYKNRDTEQQNEFMKNIMNGEMTGISVMADFIDLTTIGSDNSNLQLNMKPNANK